MASIQATTNVVMTGATGLVLLGYIFHPVYPPPNEVVAAAAALLSPPAHLIGRGIYRRIAKWAGPDDEDDPPALRAPAALAASVPGKTTG